jgi:biopolymer transport protein ExbD
MNFQPPEDEEIGMDLTPLIDMVFQLLVFFLITTTFAVNVKEGGLEVDLPRAKSTEIPSLAKHVVLAVLKDGRVVMGGEALAEGELEKKLQEVATADPSTMIIVQADRSVEHGRVVRVMDLASTLGLKRLAIATLQE